MGVLPILLMIAMLATLAVLVVGLVGFFHGGEFNRKYGKKKAAEIDPSCAMDLQAARVDYQPWKALESPEVDVWLIAGPSGDPFSMENFYGTGKLLPQQFRDLFHENWEPLGHSKVFNVWIRKGTSLQFEERD